jgi:hypothetical protein
MSPEDLKRLIESSPMLNDALRASPIGAALRAMEWHSHDLKHCWLLVSDLSRPNLSLLKEACGKYFRDVKLHDIEVQDVYTSIDEVYNATHKIFDGCGIETNGELAAKDVIADVTGGTAIMSIAMAMACLDDERTVEYIEQKTRRKIYRIDLSWGKIMRRPAKPILEAPESV